MSNETQQETWNATHAQLLKSVADAQGKLLAAQNETNDRLERQAKEILGVNETLHRIRDRLDVFNVRLDAQNGILKALLAPPRRRVERLRTKRSPQRKQRR